MKLNLLVFFSLCAVNFFLSNLAFAQNIMTGQSEGMNFKVERVASELGIPWGIAQISQNELLITDRAGTLYRVNSQSGETSRIEGVPESYNKSQGGLLDIALAQNFEKTAFVYFTYAKEHQGIGQTALARGKLSGNTLIQLRDLFVSQSAGSSGRHFGSRIVFDDKGKLFMSIGDHGDRDNGQNINSHAGSIVRLDLDGKPVRDNPFYDTKIGLAEIWSYGHRNPQGMFYDPLSDRLWAIEHGPRGGDEINLIRKGLNYGWATISYGKEYWGPIQVGEGTHKEGMEQPIKYFVPSIAPSDLLVYRGNAFPKWKGSLITASMKLKHLNRSVPAANNGKIIIDKEERLLESLGERIRAIHESPEGWIYFTTDSGKLMRLSPLSKLVGAHN